MENGFWNHPVSIQPAVALPEAAIQTIPPAVIGKFNDAPDMDFTAHELLTGPVDRPYGREIFSGSSSSRKFTSSSPLPVFSFTRWIGSSISSFSFPPAAGPFFLHFFRIYGLGKDFAASTDFHLLGPTSLRLSPADRSIDEPAEVTQVKFPRRAGLPSFGGTAPNIPTGAEFPRRPPPIGY
jgi:hypothetical protein